MRGDLQEGHGCSSRCQSLYFRAHKRHFCALLPFGTPVFGHFEHKIEVFVRFCQPKPSFSGFSSTKSRFLCQKGQFFSGFTPFRAQNGSSSNFVLSSWASLEDFNPKESVGSSTIHTSLDIFHFVIQTLNQSIAYWVFYGVFDGRDVSLDTFYETDDISIRWFGISFNPFV